MIGANRLNASGRAMLVQNFLDSLKAGTAAERAEAVTALAGAYLQAALSADERQAAETAMTLALDDPSPVVRRALAEAVAGVSDADACLCLLENSGAEIAPMTLKRIVERHGREPRLSDTLLARTDLPL